MSDFEVGILQFPGSNCDRDCVDVLQRHFRVKTKLIWHTEANLGNVAAVVIPGGFSYGDYLRSGALASHSPILSEVKKFASEGRPVLGICNGFQVLTESHILPGALLPNLSKTFICENVDLVPSAGESVYQKTIQTPLRMPIAHGDGRYFCSESTLKQLQDNGQIAFRYGNADQSITEDSNPNGSIDHIAGIVNEGGNVLGMMPHPERATDTAVGGSNDGLRIWEAFLASFL